MIWKDHSKEVPEGAHAFLSPSKVSWLRYSDDHLKEMWLSNKASLEGTEMHELAATLIRKKVKLKGTRQTFNMYVNDAIGYRLTPEVPLYFSPICFGTADAIGYDDKKKILRIHDLKTGTRSKPHMEQLHIYAALFCLDYNIDPYDLEDIITRLYFLDDIIEDHPEPEEIDEIMKTIVDFNNKIIKLEEED